MSEKKPNLRILYHWDAASDKISVASSSSAFKLKLSAFSGMTKDEIDEEIEKRTKLIKELADKNVCKMPDVIEEFRKFINKERPAKETKPKAFAKAKTRTKGAR